MLLEDVTKALIVGDNTKTAPTRHGISPLYVRSNSRQRPLANLLIGYQYVHLCLGQHQPH